MDGDQDRQNVYLWGSAQKDLAQTLRLVVRWLQGNRHRFGGVGPRLGIRQQNLEEMYESVHFYLSLFGDTANSCKRAATFIVAFCTSVPIVVADDGGLSDEEARLLLLANAEAAYEIGEVIARYARHLTPTNQESWRFQERAKFPSNHSYTEFISNLTRFRTVGWPNITPAQMEVTICQLAIIMELAFYRTNPDIAGIADPDLWEVAFNRDGLRPFRELHFRRNADTKKVDEDPPANGAQ